MSAYIVNKEHVLYLVCAAMSRCLRGGSSQFHWYFGNENHNDLSSGDYDKAAEVANMLWRENIASVSGRYPNESSATLPGPRNQSFVIEPEDFSTCMFDVFDPVQVIKSCHCYSYQSCEHDGWKASEAKGFVDTLEQAAIGVLPGYDKAAWGSPEPRRGRFISLSRMARS